MRLRKFDRSRGEWEALMGTPTVEDLTLSSDDRRAAVVHTMCLSTRGGYGCTRLDGHGGRCAAGTRIKVVAVWWRE